MTFISDNPHAYRGYFISKFTEVETAISAFLTLYFLKGSELSSDGLLTIVVDRLTFESKRAAYKAVLDDHSVNVDGFVKTKNNKWPYANLFDEIRQLNEVRIQYAHYLMDEDRFGEDNAVITLIEFRDSPKVHEYTQKEFDKLIEKIEKVENQINETYKYIKK